MDALIIGILVIGVIWIIYVAATDIKTYKPPKGSNEPVKWSLGHKIRYTLMIVIGVHLLVTLHTKFGLFSSEEEPVTTRQILTDIKKKELTTLGMKFNDFRTKYESSRKQQNFPDTLKMQQVQYEGQKNCYYCLLDKSIVMVCGIDKSTDFIHSIAVSVELNSGNKNTDNSLLLLQSLTFSNVVAVFDSSMEDKKYRDSVIKRLYDNIGKDKVKIGNLRCQALRDGNILTLLLYSENN